MTNQEFFAQLDLAIGEYDLLCHPFYRAWAEGELTREDLREYAENYFHHVEAFPSYLGEFASRSRDKELGRAVAMNRADELGAADRARPHAELWLDFAEGMGGKRRPAHAPVKEIKQLTGWFHTLAREGAPEEALAAFYAYESQVPRIACEKERGLREKYGADEKTCGYFRLHATADIHHSRIWRQQLGRLIQSRPASQEKALRSAAKTAEALWRALDGIEAARRARSGHVSSTPGRLKAGGV
jgi:pyrroloquinoline-quinone synthase